MSFSACLWSWLVAFWRMALVLMSKRELIRVEVLARLSEGRIDASSAAQLIRVSELQVYRLLKAFKNDGAASLAHRHRGRRSNNRISSAPSA